MARAIHRSSWLLTLCLTANLVVTPVAAQSAPGSGQQRARSRDPLRNGAIIGTVIGGVALGAFALTLCKAYQEEGGGSCLPGTLRFVAIGGALGAGTGLAIDAARSQRGVTVRFAIRF
jgi:hypothetical protein